MRLGIIVVVMFGTIVTGCGGGGDESSPPSTEGGGAPAVCEPGEGCPITREQFGEEWPFTVESGVLGCGAVEGSPGVGSVVFEADGSGGTFYAINGTAKGLADEQGWHPLEEIWADDPATAQYGGKVSIEPIIELGLSTCP